MDLSDYKTRLLLDVIEAGKQNGRYVPLSVELAGKGKCTQGGIGLARVALYFDENGDCTVSRSYDVTQPHLFDELATALKEVDVDILMNRLPPVELSEEIIKEVERRKLPVYALEVWTAQERIDNFALPVIFAVYVCGMDGARWIDVWTPILTPFKEAWKRLVEFANDEWP